MVKGGHGILIVRKRFFRFLPLYFHLACNARFFTHLRAKLFLRVFFFLLFLTVFKRQRQFLAFQLIISGGDRDAHA